MYTYVHLYRQFHIAHRLPTDCLLIAYWLSIDCQCHMPRAGPGPIGPSMRLALWDRPRVPLRTPGGPQGAHEPGLGHWCWHRQSIDNQQGINRQSVGNMMLYMISNRYDIIYRYILLLLLLIAYCLLSVEISSTLGLTGAPCDLR